MDVGILGTAVMHPLGMTAEVLWLECKLARATTPDEPSSTVYDPRLRSASSLHEWDELRMDRTSRLAIAVARAALRASNLPQHRVAECGMIVGNMLAGWSFMEPQLRHLHTTGLSAVSPYVAVAWFPAAPQGETSIRLGLHGYSKTVSTDRCAGSQAIGLAFQRLRSGRSETLLAGGVEAPIAPIILDAYRRDGGVGRLSEGAAMLVLSAETYAEIRIGAFQTVRFQNGILLAAVREFVEKFGNQYPIHLVVLNTPPDAKQQRILGDMVKAAIGRGSHEVPEILVTTDVLGECFAASGAIDAVLAVAWLQRQARPCSALVVTAGLDGMEMLWIYRATNCEETI